MPDFSPMGSQEQVFLMDKIIVDEREFSLIIERLAAEIAKKHIDSPITLIGIQRRGADLARRLGASLSAAGKEIRIGALDINLYRDDWTALKDGAPVIGASHIPFDLNGKYVILVDDVLFSGRTVRAALEAVLDYGRPKAIELLVLIDRGHREVPIAANYTGRRLETGLNQQVDVLLKERDGEDKVILKES